MLVTHSEVLAQRACRLRNYGQSVRYQHPELGLNSRLDEIQAAMLTERFKWLPAFTARRRHIAAVYRKGIESSRIQQLFQPEEDNAHVYHLFVVTCKERDALQAHLQQQKIQALIHYPIPIHHQRPCTGIKRDPLGLSHSELHAASCLSLPCHPQMSDGDIEAVITAVNSFK
jgi:dTDP-4-amino-4,6-dideoxygalactose transaminase